MSISACVAYDKYRISGAETDSEAVGAHLLELQQFGRLHQMLKLESALRHLVRLAPLFDTCDVVLDLHSYK